MAPRSLRKHSWVVRLARGLHSHYKDLHTFDKDRERNSESKWRRGKSLCLFSEGRKSVFALILIPALKISQYSQRLTLYTIFSLHLFIFNFILPCTFFEVIFLDRYINSQLNIIYSLYINSQFLCQEEDSVNLVKWLTAFSFKHLGATVKLLQFNPLIPRPVSGRSHVLGTKDNRWVSALLEVMNNHVPRNMWVEDIFKSALLLAPKQDRWTLK